ncbi:MAG TPA: hypothetical protein VMV27_14220 [Candidatus Binataceae bacterium]|nr:hypothetical protein [Candidatus Binataceae bacterium]
MDAKRDEAAYEAEIVKFLNDNPDTAVVTGFELGFSWPSGAHRHKRCRGSILPPVQGHPDLIARAVARKIVAECRDRPPITGVRVDFAPPSLKSAS